MKTVYNATPAQQRLLAELERHYLGLKVRWDETRGVATSIRGDLAQPSKKGEKAEVTVRAFLAHFGELLGPAHIIDNLDLLRSRTDNLGWTHLEYQQYCSPNNRGGGKGGNKRQRRAEVYLSKLITHTTADGTLREVQSSCWRDVKVESQPRITEKKLRESLVRELAQVPGFRELEARMRKRKETRFPLMQKPRLVVYPWQGGFLWVWVAYAYGVVDVKDMSGRQTGAKTLEFGHAFIDATRGKLLLFAPTTMHAETPSTGWGLAVTPLGGPLSVRTLNITREGTTSIYRLRDTTHGRNIVTYDVACNSNLVEKADIVAALAAGTLPLSEDIDGDKTWDRLPADTGDAERNASQQPEVDAHYFCRLAYEWYEALAGGRDGWDNGQFDSSLVPPQDISVLTHVRADGNSVGTPCQAFNAHFRYDLFSGKWYSYLAFFDGNPSLKCTAPNDRAFDYLAGSQMIVGHEYQHGITNFSFMNGAGEPGLDYNGWFAAIHEGLSDVFGCLFSGNWVPGPEISPAGVVVRNLAYPCDLNSWGNQFGFVPCTLGWHTKDHFADRDWPGVGRYGRGTILAHTAYFMGQGGVHQRVARVPELIPVYSIGKDMVGNIDIPRAAQIWYRGLTYYFSTFGALTGIPANDENSFRIVRDGCVSAAEDLYGAGSKEHSNTILAFYATGLHPEEESYGADVTFLRWGHAWRLSRPYIGLNSPTWASLDLFINNGGISEWNAQVNVVNASGNPTDFENAVYCRVRNVGDVDATNVQVQFFYAKLGTGIVTWLPVQDRNGVVQTLSIATLAAGQSNFPDSDQDSPPTSASVKWYIPPLAQGETVDHFCLKAQATADNDVNPHNNDVQSNIAYIGYAPGSTSARGFMVSNSVDREARIELRVDSTTLPGGWRVRIVEPSEGMHLKRGEGQLLHVALDTGPGEGERLDAPFDGEVRGRFFGALTGDFRGALMKATGDPGQLRGLISARLDYLGTVIGRFEGSLDVLTGSLIGRITGVYQCAGKPVDDYVCAGIKACLRPWRRVDICQVTNAEETGGITIQVQVPPRHYRLPTAHTKVTPEGKVADEE